MFTYLHALTCSYIRVQSSCTYSHFWGQVFILLNYLFDTSCTLIHPFNIFSISNILFPFNTSCSAHNGTAKINRTLLILSTLICLWAHIQIYSCSSLLRTGYHTPSSHLGDSGQLLSCNRTFPPVFLHWKHCIILSPLLEATLHFLLFLVMILWNTYHVSGTRNQLFWKAHRSWKKY